MKINGHFDRRGFLQLAGLLGVSAAFPSRAFAEDAGTLKLRVDGDIQKLDPAYIIGNIEEVVNTNKQRTGRF